MVMFRDFASRKARSLNITGSVENLEDRNVRVIAEGEEENLNRFIEHLNRGPFAARVARVDVDWGKSTGEFSGFNIIYS